jgi:hypothetical protein
VVNANVATASTVGAVTPTMATSTSFANVANACVLNMATGCAIGADVIRVQSHSVADGTMARSTADGTVFTNLNILGMPINPGPNTTIGIPGVATVTLNEQICDDGASLSAACSDGPRQGHAGLTVRAVHVVVTVAPILAADVVVAEAHSDATFQADCDCAREKQ